jgi:phage terminase Nu1 subunit (DNA packaging protein)
MSELNRQQLCAALGISESTVRRLELSGLPCTPVGTRSKRYNLEECKAWLRSNPITPKKSVKDMSDTALQRAGRQYMDSVKKVKLRVMPSQ